MVERHAGGRGQRECLKDNPQPDSTMNIDPLDEGFFDWTDGKRKASVELYYKLTGKKIGNAITWYQTKRRSKRKIACWLQFFVIALGAFATMIPSISQIVGREGSFFS